MPAGANIVMEVHYAPGSIGQTAPVKLRLKFKTNAVIREVYHDPLLVHFPPSLQEPALAIPPDQVSTFHAQSVQTAPVALSFLSVFPHMHLLGKNLLGLSTPKYAMAPITDRKACLLANHGLNALGRDLADAMAVATEVESLCQQYLIARQSGTPVLLSAEEMNQVIQRFKTYGRHAASIE
jgi:hypothetical protein